MKKKNEERGGGRKGAGKKPEKDKDREMKERMDKYRCNEKESYGERGRIGGKERERYM